MKTNTKFNITINEKNANKINAAISAVEGKATARTADYASVVEAVKIAEQRLSILPKRLWNGATGTYQPDSVSNSYGYRAEGTFVVVKRVNTRWVLVDVLRGFVRSGTCSENTDLRLRLVVDPREALQAISNSVHIDFIG